MLRIRLITLLSLLVMPSAFARPKLQHLELELSSEDYRRLTDAYYAAHPEKRVATDELQMIMDIGKRNLDWITFINQVRPADQQLELSTPATQPAYPITSPGTSNRTIIHDAYAQEQTVLPNIMTKVLLQGGAFVSTLPIDDATFLTHAREVDRIYQKASRWLLEEPNLADYAAMASSDLRGFYYLSVEPNLDGELMQWQDLDEPTRTKLKGWLIQQCVSATADNPIDCDKEFTTEVDRTANATGFYAEYQGQAASNYNSYFVIDGGRHDVRWSGTDPNNMYVPFLKPDKPEVQTWLQTNIQDEWRFGSWQLHLDFQPTGDASMTHVVFVAGATPHVDGLGGSEITMDSNRDIEEYTSRWTIRHEYGHTIGFPDCYLEFYDTAQGVMINYQLDITNLMCSRQGHIKQSHVDELNRVYYKKPYSGRE